MDNKQAKNVAAEWNGGQTTALYALSATGTIVDGILEEIDGCLDVTKAFANMEQEKVKLQNLQSYVKNRRNRNPVDGWRDL